MALFCAEVFNQIFPDQFCSCVPCTKHSSRREELVSQACQKATKTLPAAPKPKVRAPHKKWQKCPHSKKYVAVQYIAWLSCENLNHLLHRVNLFSALKKRLSFLFLANLQLPYILVAPPYFQASTALQSFTLFCKCVKTYFQLSE